MRHSMGAGREAGDGRCRFLRHGVRPAGAGWGGKTAGTGAVSLRHDTGAGRGAGDSGRVFLRHGTRVAHGSGTGW